ncbi:hypothetical protein N7463_000778 [Penicillium fimorum]|uniref:Uncharacterized protein n=1 Tax=Penicillium fimorum TaxID=1882269 RepID=A0A9W9Y4Y9_9EURO|nr:hypothetical protein N7463_000778 [Penicillium fimorum]
MEPLYYDRIVLNPPLLVLTRGTRVRRRRRTDRFSGYRSRCERRSDPNSAFGFEFLLQLDEVTGLSYATS